MFDVITIGECLIDFTPAGVGETGAALFAREPGGAPANVTVALSRLENKTAFIGKVGADFFGEYLKFTLGSMGVNTDHLLATTKAHTTLAFVHIDPTGERSFEFYRRLGADSLLKKEELRQDFIQQTKIFHFGSFSLSTEPSRTATFAAVKMAKEAGALISYDVNFRKPVWESKEEALRQMHKGLQYADIVKVSYEEMYLLSGVQDVQEGARIISEHGASLVLVTLGRGGAFYRTENAMGQVPTFDVHTIDTNGAGDAFVATILHALVGKTAADLKELTTMELSHIVERANAAGALATTKSGAMPAMPPWQKIQDCCLTTPHLIVEA